MAPVRSLGRLVLSHLLAIGVVAGALLPPEHLHLAGIEGRAHAIVHRHAVQGSDSGPSAASMAAHGSHERALFLGTFYDSVSPFTHAPAVLEAVVVALPVLEPLAFLQTDDAQRAHGPPGAACPTRAPPALV